MKKKISTHTTHIFIILSITFSIIFSRATPALAMHISEGILPMPWAIFWTLLAVPFLIRGLFEIKREKETLPSYLPLLGMIGAAVFVFSCLPIPVPIAGTCSHPAGTGLSVILLGFSPSVMVAAAALLIQALFLAHGGLTTFGANVFSMGIMGSVAGLAAFQLGKSMRLPLFWRAFIAGVAADLATYLATSVELGLALHGDQALGKVIATIFISFLPTQLPLCLLEGVLTAGAVVYIYKHRPVVLQKLQVV
ncbi:MAG: energy-coupling factor ABC transporter permease [bacterium]|nr:energy-coupling factor ABC transporter permease [bacterium]